MGSGNWKISYVAIDFSTVYKMNFLAYPLPKIKFLTFLIILNLQL